MAQDELDELDDFDEFPDDAEEKKNPKNNQPIKVVKPGVKAKVATAVEPLEDEEEAVDPEEEELKQKIEESVEPDEAPVKEVRNEEVQQVQNSLPPGTIMPMSQRYIPLVREKTYVLQDKATKTELGYKSVEDMQIGLLVDIIERLDRIESTI